MEQTVYSVTNLNQYIRSLLGEDPQLRQLCVRGELSNYKIYPSGHHYFTLKDTESSIRCVMFKSSAGKLRFRPESGMSVTVSGRVDVYPRDGAYQLYVSDMEPQGMGDLYAAFEQLKKKLAEEGLFDPAHKKPIPRFPGRIAVITSGAGAAVRDVIRVAGKRWPMAKIVVLPVQVQGVEAPPQIAGALYYADRWQVADVIICGRGGGSIEDLWAFNDERVARAIYACQTPVISAVGHEPDVTISDFVADLRAATPSNGAELAAPDQNELRDTLHSYAVRGSQAVIRRLEAGRRTLNDLSSRRVLQSPTAYIDQKRMELDMRRGALSAAQGRRVAEGKHDFIRLAAAMDALSPLKTLRRGYAIVTDSTGRTLRRVADVDVGQDVSVALSDGSLRCRVEERKEQN